MTDETEETKTKEPEVQNQKPEKSVDVEQVIDDLEKDFENFRNSKTEHEIEPQPEPEKSEKSDLIPSGSDSIEMVEDFKLQMLLGLMFALLDGLHSFLYKFISKVEIPKDQLSLDDSDREALQIYFRTQRVMNLINKLPSEVIGFVHMEYLYYQKFKQIKEEQEQKHQKKIVSPTEEKAPVKKTSSKKKSSRKKPAKKAAAKKELDK